MIGSATESHVLIDQLVEYLEQESPYHYIVRRSPATGAFTIRCENENSKLVYIAGCPTYNDLIYTLCIEIVKYTPSPQHAPY